jgi:hypothetical protein
LIHHKLRKIAQIELGNSKKWESQRTVTDTLNFLREHKIAFYKNDYRILLAASKHQLDSVDMTFGEKFGKQLGQFYKCSSESFRRNHYRVVIKLNYKDRGFELFAQMCNKPDIDANLLEIYNFFNRVSNAFAQLDKSIVIDVESYND